MEMIPINKYRNLCRSLGLNLIVKEKFNTAYITKSRMSECDYFEYNVNYNHKEKTILSKSFDFRKLKIYSVHINDNEILCYVKFPCKNILKNTLFNYTISVKCDLSKIIVNNSYKLNNIFQKQLLKELMDSYNSDYFNFIFKFIKYSDITIKESYLIDFINKIIETFEYNNRHDEKYEVSLSWIQSIKTHIFSKYKNLAYHFLANDLKEIREIAKEVI
jgi:hypothetical protein